MQPPANQHILSRSRFTSSLAYPGYRRLFISTSLAGMANWTLLVARGWLAFDLTGSSTWVGVVTFAGLLPFVLGPLGGVLADRYERKRLAAVSTGVGAVLSLVLAFMTLSGVLEPWHLAGLTLLMSLPRAAELPARQALISNVVPQGELVNAVALSGVANFGTRALGPALVVPLIDGLGPGGVFLISSAFYFMGTFSMLSIGVPARVISTVRTGAAASILEGLAFIRSTPSVAAMMLLVVFHCSLTMSFDSLLPVFAVQELQSHGASFSVMAMGVGIGALAGTFWVSGVRTEGGQGTVLLVSAVISGIAPMAMALPHELMSVSMATTTMFLMGASQGAFMSLTGALLQVAAPDHLRGRVASVFLLSAGGVMAWMNLLNGALADIWHVPSLFLVPALAYLALLGALYLLAPTLRTLFRRGTFVLEPATVV